MGFRRLANKIRYTHEMHVHTRAGAPTRRRINPRQWQTEAPKGPEDGTRPFFRFFFG